MKQLLLIVLLLAEVSALANSPAAEFIAVKSLKGTSVRVQGLIRSVPCADFRSYLSGDRRTPLQQELQTEISNFDSIIEEIQPSRRGGSIKAAVVAQVAICRAEVQDVLRQQMIQCGMDPEADNGVEK